MADNCYWIEEDGAIQLCAAISLPPLTDGWITFDSLPDTIAGRDHYTTFPGNSQHPQFAKPAYGNDLLVIAVAFSYGVQPTKSVDGSHETYGVFVSDDDGFTYGPLIEKFPWLPGGAQSSGYDATSDYYGVNEHFGTKISFDGTDTFFVVSNTVNDADDYDVLTRTSVSTDGVIWSTSTVVGHNHSVVGSDSFDGDVWYVGFNGPSEPDPADEAFFAAHSADDGATWTAVELTRALNWGVGPRDTEVDISATAEGAHISYNVYDSGSGFNGTGYFRPTSATTWAARLDLFDYDDGIYYDDARSSLVASKVNAGHVYVCKAGFDSPNDAVWFRRSTDYGVTWEARYPALTLSDAASQEFHWALAQNFTDMVELDDGRIVIVMVISNDASWGDLIYAQSSDGGISFSPFEVVSVASWIADDTSGGQRIHATAKGNDVVVTATARETAGNTFIFRP